MKTYSISKLARACGLSRSTLLYYDRLGLLPPSGRTGSGYRCYSDIRWEFHRRRWQGFGDGAERKGRCETICEEIVKNAVDNSL